jgi:CubicO group peptidase (beta-lactamase class C family)
MISRTDFVRPAKQLSAMFLVLLLAVSVYAKELPTAAPEDVGLSSEKLQSVDKTVSELIDDNKVAGAVVVVARRGKVAYSKSFGKMDIEADKVMKEDTIFRIYSMSKPITTVAAMILFDEGKLKLDDPVAKYLTPFKGLKVHGPHGELQEQQRPMSIRDLMRHTSGLTYGIFGDTPVDKKYREYKVLDRDSSLAEMVERLGKIPLLHQPGSKWQYSMSTDVLGRVVEVVSEKPLDEFFKERIFEPLDMKDSGFHVPQEKLNRFAANYAPDGNGGLKLKDSPSTSRYLKKPKRFSGGGGLVSTARDYTRFCQMLIDGGQLDGKRLLKEETVAMMLKNQTPKGAKNGDGFGLGFYVNMRRKTGDPPVAIGEYGWAGAASTHFWIVPKDDMIVIALQQHMPHKAIIKNKINPLVYGAIVD